MTHHCDSSRTYRRNTVQITVGCTLDLYIFLINGAKHNYCDFLWGYGNQRGRTDGPHCPPASASSLVQNSIPQLQESW